MIGTAAWQAVKRHILDPDRLQRGGTFNPDAAAFRIQVKLFERFSADVKRAGARPVILLFPDRESLHEHHRRGLPLIYAPLKDALQHRGIETVDLSRAFPVNADDHQIDSWFNPGGHYSPKGNAIIGQAVGEYLSHHVTLASVASASDKECARVSLNETQPPRLPASLDEARRAESGARALSA